MDWANKDTIIQMQTSQKLSLAEVVSGRALIGSNQSIKILRSIKEKILLRILNEQSMRQTAVIRVLLMCLEMLVLCSDKTYLFYLLAVNLIFWFWLALHSMQPLMRRAFGEVLGRRV